MLGIASHEHHFTLAPGSPGVIVGFKVRLGNYVVWKNRFQIPVGREIARELVGDSVRARLAELDQFPLS